MSVISSMVRGPRFPVGPTPLLLTYGAHVVFIAACLLALSLSPWLTGVVQELGLVLSVTALTAGLHQLIVDGWLTRRRRRLEEAQAARVEAEQSDSEALAMWEQDVAAPFPVADVRDIAFDVAAEALRGSDGWLLLGGVYVASDGQLRAVLVEVQKPERRTPRAAGVFVSQEPA